MGRVALVTGGTRGIGAAVSVALRTAGYEVTANYGRNDEAAASFHEATGIPVLKFDVADFEDCRKAVERLHSRGAIDVLVNNAGIARVGLFHKMSLDDWRVVIDTNLSSVFNMCRQVIGPMRERRFGRIVNIGSLNGQAGEYGHANYVAAKAGLHGLTKALAQENAAHNITVNTVAPGYIETDMSAIAAPKLREKLIARIPVGRFGAPEEIARCVTFLTADEAGFITGATLSVNGGQYMD